MKTLSKEQVLRLHNALLETFGGTAGIRDDGLLESALNAPFATFGGQYLYPCRPPNSLYGWLHFCGFGGQKIVHIQQFIVFGRAGQIVQRVVGGGVIVGCGAAVLGASDVWVLQQIVFVVHHRALPSDEQDALAVIQQAHLVRGHKVFATMSSGKFKKGKRH